MKLDPRIIEGKKPLTCFNTEMAKQFIGKECYFCDCPLAFEDLDKFTTLVRNVLFSVQDTEKPFVTDTIGCFRYAYCLPCEWVNSEEPKIKWRPFSLTEWRHIYAIGDEIVFRIKDSDTVRAFMFCGLYSDHDDDLPGKGVISLGSELFVLQNLFDQFELRRNDEWQPFGVLVKGDGK